MNASFLLPVNLYGPRDNFDLGAAHVIPALIRKCIEARESGLPEVELWRDGSPKREFLLVKDAARAIVAATANYDGAEPVNIGSGEEVSISDLARKIDGRLSPLPLELRGTERAAAALHGYLSSGAGIWFPGLDRHREGLASDHRLVL